MKKTRKEIKRKSNSNDELQYQKKYANNTNIVIKFLQN